MKKQAPQFDYKFDPAYLVSEIQLSYKSKYKASERPKVISSKDAHGVLFSSWNQDTIDYQEEGKALFLNRANDVHAIFNLSKGGTAGTVIDPKMIIVAALLTNAYGIILAHNHPSQSMKPSRQDEQLTQKIKQNCQMFDIKMLDHIILCGEKDSYYSFADNGLI